MEAIKAKARLKWFLDFLSIDIDSLHQAEFFKLLADLGSILYDPYLSAIGSGKFPFIDSPDMRGEIKDYQEELKKILNSILAKGPGVYDFSRVKSLEDLVGLLKIFQDPRGPVIDTVTMTVKILRVKDRALLVTASIKDTILTQFMDSLSSFSLDNIKKCEREDCGRYFLKATKREKRYCSNRCAWVVNSRERRKASTKKTNRHKEIKG